MGGDDVEPAVAVEVAADDGGRPEPDPQVRQGLEAPVAGAQQDRHVVGQHLRGGQVEAAVAVEVAGDEADVRTRLIPQREAHRGLERPVAPAQQHRDLGGDAGDGQVEAAVAVEVARRRGTPTMPPSRTELRPGTSVPPAQQQRHALGAGIGGGQVEPAVAVEVAGDDAQRRTAHGETLRRLERPVAPAQVDRNGGRAGIGRVQTQVCGNGGGVDIGGRQVEAAVAVEVAHGEDGRQVLREEDPLWKHRERPVAPAQEDHAPVAEQTADEQVEFGRRR